MASMGPPAADAPSPTGPLRGRRPTWLLGGTVLAIAIIVIVLVFAGIPGVSLNASSGGSSSHAIIFSETGLPTGTGWMVYVRGVNSSYSEHSSNRTSISVVESNGIYVYAVASAAGYNPDPSVGQVDVNGSNVAVSITFGRSLPLGASLSWGTPYNVTGTQAQGCPATTGHYCYSIEIAGAGNGIATSNILLTLRNVEGATVPWPTGIDVSLFSPSNISAVATYDTVLANWTLEPPFDGALSSGFTLEFYTAEIGAGNGLMGLQLVAVGQNGFSGTVSSVAFS